MSRPISLFFGAAWLKSEHWSQYGYYRQGPSNHAMSRLGQHRILVADSSKFEKRSPCQPPLANVQTTGITAPVFNPCTKVADTGVELILFRCKLYVQFLRSYQRRQQRCILFRFRGPECA